MTNYDLEEVNLLNWQLLLSSFFILSTFVSLSLTYNEVLKRKKKVPLYSDQEQQNILKFNRLLASSIALGFLFINIKDKNVRLLYNDCDERAANMQITASVFTLIATTIVLYIAFTNYQDSADNLNPEL